MGVGSGSGGWGREGVRWVMRLKLSPHDRRWCVSCGCCCWEWRSGGGEGAIRLKMCNSSLIMTDVRV